MAGLEMRQRQMRGAVRGLESRLVAVKGHHRLGRTAPQQMQLILGQRGAQRRHGRLEARPHQRDHVHIAFGDDDGLRLEPGGARGGEIVELMALGEELRLAGVDVFGLGVGFERARAERHDAAARIGDGKHHAVEEEIARAAVFVGGRARPAAIMSSSVDVLGLQMLDQRGVAGRRIAQAELFAAASSSPRDFR